LSSTRKSKAVWEGRVLEHHRSRFPVFLKYIDQLHQPGSAGDTYNAQGRRRRDAPMAVSDELPWCASCPCSPTLPMMESSCRGLKAQIRLQDAALRPLRLPAGRCFLVDPFDATMWPLPPWFPLRSTALPHPVVGSSNRHFRVLLVRRGVRIGGRRGGRVRRRRLRRRFARPVVQCRSSARCVLPPIQVRPTRWCAPFPRASTGTIPTPVSQLFCVFLGGLDPPVYLIT